MVTKMIKIILIVALCSAISVAAAYCIIRSGKKTSSFATIKRIADIQQLFPMSVEEIEIRTRQALQDAQAEIDAIIAVPDVKRTVHNTLIPFDHALALSDLSILRNAYGALEMVAPQETIRTGAHEAVKRMNEFWVDAVENNKKLYEALASFSLSKQAEELTPEQRYFLTKTIEDYKRSGIDLPEDKRARAAQLKKDLAKLSQEFELAIATDNRSIRVKKEDLEGLDPEFIATLQPAADGEYTLGTDYPTYFAIMENCTVEKTRKKLYQAFSNRGYPLNKANLELVIAKRDELAQLLGFSCYTECDLADQMVKTTQKAEQFLDDLLARGFIKEALEYEKFAAELPDSVTLNAQGKLNPWDVAFVKATYKKKHFSVDETTIAHYFPMQKTIDALLDIYHQFFSIDFKQVPASGFWYGDVQLIEVYDTSTQQLIGYLLLDLYPRPNKFTHACNITLVPAVINEQGEKPPAVSLVLANFPKPTDNKPSLLKRDDVNTFFHEFGHALHGLLGRTHVASFSGTSVKSDFVEMPSQMLEEWLWDPEILRKVSNHYKTGQPLSDELIAKITSLKHFDSGYWVIRQVFLSQLSLDYFNAGERKNVDELMHSLYLRTMPHVAFAHDNHFYASFGHLMGYGAKYYGYLWSKVFALDLFNEIKKQGLLNPAIGKKYVTEVIGKGGSQDPNDLLRNFLGREPNADAFFKDLGI